MKTTGAAVSGTASLRFMGIRSFRTLAGILALFLVAAFADGCGKDAKDEAKPASGGAEFVPPNRYMQIFLEAKAEKAANYIADRFQEGGTVAFLIDEVTYNDAESDNHYVLEAIQKRLSERGFTCDEVVIVGESKESADKKTGEVSTGNEDPTDAAIMEKKLKPLVDKVDMVVNFVGLPESLSEAKLNFLTRKNTSTGKNNMMLLCDTGLPFVPQEMLKKNRVCAIIDYISYADNEFDMQENAAPKDLSDAFDLMYFFVNADTLESYIADNPNYFIAK